MWPAPYTRKELYNLEVACEKRGKELYKKIQKDRVDRENMENFGFKKKQDQKTPKKPTY